jgi:hypothetical protein
VLSRWLADYRFMSGGKHKIYFVLKKYPLKPEDMEIYSFREYVKTQEPKLKEKFVAIELITTGKEREINKSPLY